jgi:hypothetical protein
MEGRLVENGLLDVFVSGNVGAPATAQLQLTPTNTLKHLLHGTWVHVFVTDPWDLDPKGDLSDFKLLFEGVVIGKGFTKEAQGRAFVVQCAGPEIFWVEARQYWLNLTSAGGGIVEQVAYQTSLGAGRFGAVTSTGTYGYLVSRIGQIQADQQERFFDTLLAVIDDIGNVNPYYTNNRNRFRITDRILRAHCGKVEKLFQLALLSDFLTGLSNRVSGQTNLAEVVNLLLEPILHEWVSVPAPPYVKARIFSRDAFGNIIRKPNTTTVPDGSGRTAMLFQYEMAMDQILAGTIFKPDVYTLSPPTCNVLLPNMYDHAGLNISFLQEPTRVIMRPTLVGRDLTAVASLGLQFMRPTELEVFTQLTRDLSQGTQPGAIQKRTPDAQFADGQGQAATFNDYDWGTNEERIRGIVYNFVNLSPAPATLTLSDQGAKQPDGTRRGGMPAYLQNVASYEYYKSRFASRVVTVNGPFNMRPVPGFPLLVVDDSSANLNLLCQLKGITHHIDAQGQGSTQYQVQHARLVDELDLNRPSFQGGSDPKTGEALLELARDAQGNFDFAKLFDGQNRPPIPEWFSDDYATLTGLDRTYGSFFGDTVRVIESVLFTANAAANDKILQTDAVNAIVASYQRARDAAKEFETASTLTARSMATIDQAFRFVGAAPSEYASKPANQRTIDFQTAKLHLFEGDASAGSGYAGVPEPANPSTSRSPAGASLAVSATSRGGMPKTPQMSGAFPSFETKIHTGNLATDAQARAQARQDESGPTAFARYDGRPVMYDFEYRLWQESLKAANVSPSSAEAVAARTASAQYAAGSGGTAGPLSATGQAQSAATRKAAQTQKSAAQRAATATMSPTPAQQAPTGDSAQSSPQLPLPQPLSERQVVDLRRAVVEAWRKELGDSRGQLG